MNKRYLVTGGLGFIGASLSLALRAAGHPVRILDNSFRGAARRLKGRDREFEIVVGDIRDPEVVRRAVTGVDAVCHLAYINGTEHFYQRPALVLEVAVKGIMNVLDACLAVGVRELIVASSSEVYQTPPQVPTDEAAPLIVPDPHNPRYSYGGGKIITELLTLNYAREHFDRAIIFRPHNVFGPDMGWEHVIPQFVARMLQCRRQTGYDRFPFPIQGDGRQSRAFIGIDDFTRGVLCVLERGRHGEIYHVGSDEERTIADVAQQVANCLGLRVDVEPGALPAGGTLRRCPDVGKLRQLGFECRVPFATSLEQTVAWYREHWSEASASRAA